LGTVGASLLWQRDLTAVEVDIAAVEGCGRLQLGRGTPQHPPNL
jgi:hypothetical protein